MESRKETFTYFTVSRPSNLPEVKDGRRRKKPSKMKKNKARMKTWLERRRTTVVEKPVDEVTAAAPATNTPETQAVSVTLYSKVRVVLV